MLFNSANFKIKQKPSKVAIIAIILGVVGLAAIASAYYQSIQLEEKNKKMVGDLQINIKKISELKLQLDEQKNELSAKFNLASKDHLREINQLHEQIGAFAKQAASCQVIKEQMNIK